MLGILGWAMAGFELMKQWNTESDYKEMSRQNAIKKNNPYYYDTKGRLYHTETGIHVYRTTNYDGHVVLKDVKNNWVVEDITYNGLKASTEGNLKRAKENGWPLYPKCHIEDKDRYGWPLYFEVDGDDSKIYRKQQCITKANWLYIPQKINEAKSKEEKHKVYEDDVKGGTMYWEIKDKWYSGTWRDWYAFLCERDGYYYENPDWRTSEPDYIDTVGRRLYLIRSCKDHEPYFVAYGAKQLYQIYFCKANIEKDGVIVPKNERKSNFYSKEYMTFDSDFRKVNI